MNRFIIKRIEVKIPRWKCLDDTPEPDLIYGEPICGNGLLEKGEDCDCGTQNQEECKSDCCNAATCKFNQGADCDSADGPCCHKDSFSFTYWPFLQLKSVFFSPRSKLKS